jgi:hypothetical protein
MGLVRATAWLLLHIMIFNIIIFSISTSHQDSET